MLLVVNEVTVRNSKMGTDLKHRDALTAQGGNVQLRRHSQACYFNYLYFFLFWRQRAEFRVPVYNGKYWKSDCPDIVPESPINSKPPT